MTLYLQKGNLVHIENHMFINKKLRFGAWVVLLHLLPWTAEEFQCNCGVPKTQLCTLREDGGGVCSMLLNFGPEVDLVAVFQIMLSPDARNTAWVSFDGRKRQEICHGDRSNLFSDCIISKYRKSWFMQLPCSLTSAKRVFGSEGRSFYKP